MAKVNVYGELNCAEVDGKLARADQIYDYAKGKYQSEINDSVNAATQGEIQEAIQQLETTLEDLQEAEASAVSDAHAAIGESKKDALEEIAQAIENLEVHYDVISGTTTKNVQLKDGSNNYLVPNSGMANIMTYGGNKIEIDYQGAGTYVITIPKNTYVCWQHQSYKFPESVTITWVNSYGTVVNKCYFNINTKEIRCGTDSTVNDIDEVLLFAFTSKKASLPSNLYKTTSDDAAADISPYIGIQIYNASSKIRIEYEQGECSITFPKYTMITWKGGRYEFPSEQTLNSTISTVISKVFFNIISKEIRIDQNTSIAGVNEALLFSFSRAEGIASLPVSMYTWNGKNPIDIFSDFSSGVSRITLDVGLEGFINHSGTFVSNASWKTTNEINIASGQSLIMIMNGTGTGVASLSIVTTENENKIYTPVFKIGKSGVYKFVWTAQEACTVVVSYRYVTNDKVYLITSGGALGAILYNLNDLRISQESAINKINESIYELPDLWANKVEEINILKEDKFSFLIQTDTHYNANSQSIDAGNNINKLTKMIGFDFAANLGDIVEGYSDMDKDIYRESMMTIMSRYVDGICCPFFYCKGNHENNSMYANTLQDPSNGYIYNPEIWGRTIALAQHTSFGTQYNGRSLYYYKDFDNANIRCIFLNTNDGGNNGFDFAISDAQKNWFSNIALDTDKRVAIFSHVPLIEHLDSDQTKTHNNSASHRQLLPIIKDFKDNGGIVIGCFCGHTHLDLQNTYDGINHISFINGVSRANAVIIDSDTITIKSIGYSNDRVYTY